MDSIKYLLPGHGFVTQSEFLRKTTVARASSNQRGPGYGERNSIVVPVSPRSSDIQFHATLVDREAALQSRGAAFSFSTPAMNGETEL